MSTEKESGRMLDSTETVNVSKLIYASGTKVQFRRKDTSRPLGPGEGKIFTASASPTVYYVSLRETSEIVLGLEPKKK